MGGARKDIRQFAQNVAPPATAKVRERLQDYLGRVDMSIEEFAQRIGYGRSSVWFFLHGTYHKVGGDDLYIRAAIWDHLERNRIDLAPTARGRLFETENYRRIRSYVLKAIERGEICLLYGPPGTQKTFALEYLLMLRRRMKKEDAVYVYGSVNMSPLALLKRVGRGAGAFTRTFSLERMLLNLLHEFGKAPRPPAVIVDEAQHLKIDALEVLRELHDRSGCGLILAGSHNLYENFLRGRTHLEQWLSRIDHKEPLPGLLKDEVASIAARELGNGQPAKLSEKQVGALLKACEVDDFFARDAEGKPSPRKYLSVRRLVKTVDQWKERSSAKEATA